MSHEACTLANARRCPEVSDVLAKTEMSEKELRRDTKRAAEELQWEALATHRQACEHVLRPSSEDLVTSAGEADHPSCMDCGGSARYTAVSNKHISGPNQIGFDPDWVKLGPARLGSKLAG